MPKCKIILEPVQTKDRIYVNGETLEADETTIAGLIAAGVVIPIEEELRAKVESKEATEPTTTRRKRSNLTESEEVV